MDDWMRENCGYANRYTNPSLPGWTIYEQAKVMVWRRLIFFGQYETFAQAVEAVEREVANS